MPQPDDKTVWDLLGEHKEALHAAIERDMRKLRVPPDPQVVHDITLDTFDRYLSRPAEKRIGKPKFSHLNVIAHDLVIVKYCRSPRLNSPTDKRGYVIPLDDVDIEGFTADEDGPLTPAEKELLLKDALEALAALAAEKPKEHHAFLGWLFDKSVAQLQQELKATRDGVNNLRRRAVKFIITRLNGDTGKEK
jgi:DNA-directed RNA polymerase specialized sigma24 family protein